MRLFATVTLLALGLFWSHPFLSPHLEKVSLIKATPALHRGEPVLVLAPEDSRVQSQETAAAELTESSEDPHR